MRHLQPSPLETTLDIETLVGFTAIQYGLIAAHLFRNMIQCLNDPQSQLLALLVLGHSNILYVADKTHVVYEFALDDNGAGADNCVRGIEDDEDKVRGGNG